jgi:heptosyltransferase-3
MNSPRSILAINVSRIGDTLFCTPALRALAAAWPDAKITVLAHPKRAEVLENLPFLHRIGHITKNSARYRGRLGLKQYDLAVVWGFDQALVAYALRVARQVVAFRQRDQALNRRLHLAVEPPAFQAHPAVEQFHALVAPLGVPLTSRRIAYRVSDAEREAAQAHLAAAGFNGKHPLIGLQVASFPTRAYRDWPIESFAELCGRMIAEHPDARFLIFGGPEEKLRTSWLKQHLGERAALYAGRLTLRETGALMSLTDLYIGVDTGPTHIMSSFDIPLVGLYHCTSGASDTGPLEHPCAALLDHPLGHEACSELASMADIPVDSVYAAAAKLLEPTR